MNTGEDELSSGLNGRLRPRKSTAPQSNKIVRKSDGKTAQDRPKRTSTPSKASSTKPDDLLNKPDLPTALQLLCPYCDKKFASKQAISKHVRRIHFASSKQNSFFECLFCKHTVPDSTDIIRHMVDSHPNQYFACLDCHTRFLSTPELAEHKLNVCEKQKVSYRNKLRQKTSPGTKKNHQLIDEKDSKDYTDSNRFNGIVISCELKPSQVTDNADIEDNITTNLILPPSKTLGTNAEIEKNAVIVLDDLQWSKRMPANFSFHNTDADQILSRLGVVHRSPRNSEFAKKDWLKSIDESTQKFEKCFDTSFYSKVASNVQENLSKFLDGSFNFNPDADSTIKTRKLKNSVVINTAEGFPILLACEQFSRTTFDGYIPRTIAPKHKWKWDNEKNPMNPDDIKRDSHVNNCIITLVSSLDIWTQLCMRRKFEDKFSIAPLEKKTEIQNTISKELKEILESREIPSTSSSQVVKYTSKPNSSGDCDDFPASLGLRPAAPTYDLQPAVLSGEWVRPRCYVCCACGAQTRDSRGLSSHITTHHPNAQVQHYEIVGELLLNADILKHLYVPPSLLNNRTRPLRGFRECTKCKKSTSLEDLHQHMLDCAGDTPTVRRKCRYRPFGVRRRRPRLPDNTIRKKIRKDIRRQTRQTRKKNLIRQRPKIRTEVGDAESIRKMIADLPAKRHRALVTPTNPTLRPRKKIEQQRNKLILKRRSTEIPQSRKQQEVNRNLNNRLRSGPSQEDVDDKSSKDDDDKPLKPRLKRIVTKNSRKSETLKRKVALNRAKRRVQLKEQLVATEEEEPRVEEQPPADSASGSGNSVEQLSIGNTPQKIDVNNGPYNTREHSSRNRNNKNDNNDHDKSGGNEQNGNINHGFVPAPNEPLKHSIARLTSETDIYDKTLQFHHQMFLLQQECNSLNQHVPVGQQRLFENEAVVTKLDKPPLHFQQRGMMDPFSFQRNKLNNKPRKGLNACIAMLKNKLVDPIIPTPTSQAVGCGSDEPRLCQSATTNRRVSSADYETQINTRPAEIFSRHHFIHEGLFQLRNEGNITHEGFADIPLHFLTAQKLYEIPQRRGHKIEKVKAPKQKQSTPRRESTRRRSTRNEKDNSRNKKYVLPPHIELIPHDPDSYPMRVAPPSKVDTLHCQNIMSHVTKDINKSKSSQPFVSNAELRKLINERQDLDSLRSSLEIQSRRVSNETNLLEIKQPETAKQPRSKRAVTRLRSTSKALVSCTQSQTKRVDTYTYSQTKKSQLKQTEACKNTKSRQKQEAFIIPLQTHTEVYSQCQMNKSDSCTQPQLKQSEVYAQSQMKQSEAYAQSELKQANVRSEAQLKQLEAFSHSQMKQPEDYQQTQLNKSEDYPQSEAYTHSQMKHSEAYSQSQLKQSEAYSQSLLKQSEAYSQSQLKQSEAYTQSQVKQSEAYTQSQLDQSETYIQSQLKETEAYTQSLLDQSFSYKQSQLKQTEAYIQSQLKQSEVYTQSQMEQSESYTQSQLTQSEAYPESQAQQTEDYSHTQPKHTEAYSTCQLKPTEVYLQPHLNEIESFIPSQISTPKPLPVYTDSSFNKNNIPEAFPDRDIPRIIITHDIYPQNSYSLPLLRTNSNSSDLGTAVPLPLDLSVNTTDNSETPAKQSNSYELNDYDCYETLDLSNKSVDLVSEDIVVDDVIDGVVDLRVKNTQSSQNDLKDNSEHNQIESPTDLTLKTLHMENIPTDLSVRRKSAVYEYEQIHIDYESVQDLSKHGKSNSEKHPQIVCIPEDIINQDMPTDLSGKKDIKISPKYKSDLVDNHKDAVCAIEETSSIGPADLCARKEVSILRNHDDRREVSLMEAQNVELDIDVEKSQDSYDTNEVQSYSLKNSDTFTGNDLNVSRPNNNRSSENTSEDTSLEPAEVNFDRNDTHVAKESTTPKVIDNDDESHNIKNVPISTISNNSTKHESEHLYSEKSENIPLCQPDIALPLYTLSNTPYSRSKYESTMPVYTLANACISMSKIEPSNVAPNTEMCAIPTTTVIKISPLCTLTDSTARSEKLAPIVESNLHDRSPIKQCLVGATSSVSHQNSILTATTSFDKSPTSDKSSTNTDLDPETAKKIALLPKELVEILGNMPVDHRNQLLNVLPHYVSKSPTDAQLKDSSSMIPGSSAVETPPLTSSPMVSAHVVSPTQTQSNDEVKPLAPFLGNNNELTTVELNTFNTYITQVSTIDENRIIDLTDDDPPIEPKVKKIPDEISDVVTIANELSVPKPKKPKVNDQTASLRAVRIKAPSERNKSMCKENPSLKATAEQQIKINVQTVEDLQVTEEKSSDLDKTMAIQQAEVSSTQHNTTSTGKYPLAISPASTESSSDEASKSVAPKIPIIAVGTQIDKTKEQSILYNIPLPKPKVSSSVSSKERNVLNVETVMKNDSHNTLLGILSPVQVPDNALLSSTHKVNNAFELLDEEPAKVPPATNTNPLNQEDSDDDITLAAIVKRKQLVFKTNEELVETLETANKKKKSRKTKKNGRKAIHRKSDARQVAHENLEVPPNKILFTDSNVGAGLLSTGNNINENTKDQTEPRTESTDRQLQADVMKQYALKRAENDSQVLNDDSNRQSKSIDIIKNIIQDDRLQCKEIKDTSIKSNENFENVVQLSDTRTKKEKVKNNVCSEARIKKIFDSKFSDLEEIEKNKLKERDTEEVKATDGAQDDCPIRLHVQEKSHATSSNASNEVTATKTMSSTTKNKSNVCTVIESHKKDKKVLNNKNNVELITISAERKLVQESDSRDNLPTTPLRRSRRGKSLFLDSHSVEKEITNSSDMVSEHKAPLTKKQLIFSRLLLDERKPEHTNSNPEKLKDYDKLKYITDESILNANLSDVSMISETDKQCDVLERNKSTKRRISPHIARKSKKKKSIEEFKNSSDEPIEPQIPNDVKVSVDSAINSTFGNIEKRPSLLTDKIENINTTAENKCSDCPVPNEDISDYSLKVPSFSKDNEKSKLSSEKSITDHSVEEQADSKSDEKLKTSSEKRKFDNLLPSDLNRNSTPNKGNIEKRSSLLTDKIENKNTTAENKSSDCPVLNEDISDYTLKVPSFSKDNEKSKVSTEKSITDPSLEEQADSKSDEKLKTSSEKRKFDNLLPSDLSRNSKPKKSKTAKVAIADNSDIIMSNSELIKNDDVLTENLSDNSVSTPRTACYNVPVAARRGRSKSVVVKSAGSDLYDPYDIDLEDMIEQNESFRRKKKGSDQKSGISQKKIKTSSITIKDTCKIQTGKEATEQVENIPTKDKATLSDSDDSSKSDVPLQKYVEEKEKKNLVSEVLPSQKKNLNEKLKDSKTDDNKADIKSAESSSSETHIINENEAEQKLRSEQFMESFGFFSERKPRKSNLLATKKISETFHTNNESDDMYFGFKERAAKKGIQNDKDIKKSIDNETSKLSQPSTAKKVGKRGRKKKSCTKILPSYCNVCKKEFRRSDNYLRHQMTLLHISKLSEVEMKVKTAPVHEEPNYLMAYKQYLERFRKLTDKLSKLRRRNPKAASRIVLPTMQEILSDVNRAVREQQLSQRGLSHDEELFIDCCELLKESHNGDKANTSEAKSSKSGLDLLESTIDACFSNECESDDDVDSITAQNILDSEEVRNLENDLISGLKEAAKATLKTCSIEYQSHLEKIPPQPESNNCVAGNSETESHYEIVDFDIPEKPRSSKAKKQCSSTEFVQIKEKMYPDVIEDIDMFEDKFDKIKRKCRSQAAAAKQTVPVVKSCTSHKVRRKSEKKKVKRNSKKTRHQSTQVPTKGALKGFDGIKVSIPTSDINLSAIVPVAESSPKKKKKPSSKKRRDKKDSESSSKYDSDHHGKGGLISQNKKIDVYEFMDNEDAELFEFRPSTLMERFKSMSNKETPSTSKLLTAVDENSSESGSDGDDFVYMSDDYVCSDDETENSLLSCENGTPKLGSDIKKMAPPQKRKDVVEKNAVMGKIFKHNAVRTEKKITAPKEPVKPKANLDQLFDSLLEEEPSTSMLNSELDSLEKDEELLPLKKHATNSSKYDSDLGNDFDGSDDEDLSRSETSVSPNKIENTSASTSKRQSSSISKDFAKDSYKNENLSKRYSLEKVYKPSTSKEIDCLSASLIDYGPSTSKKYENLEEVKNVSPERDAMVPLSKSDETSYKRCEAKLQKHNEASTSKFDETIKSDDDPKPSNKKDRSLSSSFDYGADAYDQSAFDETGVARQRARRKCTVGKQNVLAESWSSESEPDGGPPRPSSAESVIGGSGRKKKGRKKDGQPAGWKRGNNRQITFKRYDIESRVNSTNRNTSSIVSSGGLAASVDDGEVAGPSGLGNSAAVASTSAAAAAAAAAAEAAASAAMPAPSTSQAPGAAGQKGRPRSVAYFWSSEGDDEQEHQQQHGWIVGDSHKKLVTMLAHAKGRKRNNDEKRHLVE